MRIAIMQPYFFPYIGYFQLINAVDKFVFYDDVNYINRGWINRNKILMNNNPIYFTIQLKKASQNRLIKEIEIINNRPKLQKTIQIAYKKAPMYKQVWPIVEECLEYDTNYIGELAIFTAKRVSKYLKIPTQFEISSKKYRGTKSYNKETRIKKICLANDASIYINSIGGLELYNKNDFLESGIKLLFLKPGNNTYQQFSTDFLPNLSIIDVMMFNSIEKIHEMLNNFELL